MFSDYLSILLRYRYMFAALGVMLCGNCFERWRVSVLSEELAACEAKKVPMSAPFDAFDTGTELTALYQEPGGFCLCTHEPPCRVYERPDAGMLQMPIGARCRP